MTTFLEYKELDFRHKEASPGAVIVPHTFGDLEEDEGQDNLTFPIDC